METRNVRQVAVIGAGPRGTSVVERLVAGAIAQGDGALSLLIHVIEPYEPGPGHIWRTDQSRLFLMNTPCLYPTVVPVGEAASGVVTSAVGVSFDEWRARVAEGIVTASVDDVEECRRLAPSGFPSRALYGGYLAWVFAETVRTAPSGVEILHHPNEAVDLTCGGDGRWRVVLDGAPGRDQDGDDPVHHADDGGADDGDDGARDGGTRDGSPDDGGGAAVLVVDDVVLALGHVATTLTPEQEQLQDAAARHGLQYWPPAVPADVDWQVIPAGKTVLVRGLGLNFFDAMIQLTEGRGGCFRELEDGRLEYEPSGREPQLVAASRRGVPYRAKAAITTYIPRGVELRFCTQERALAFRRDGVQPGFDHDLWPLLHRDVLWTYYSTLCRSDVSCVDAPQRFLEELYGALLEGNGNWETSLADVVGRHVPADHRLDVEALAHPFAGRRFDDGEQFTRVVLAHLEADAAGSARGEHDPLKMAIGALNAGRSVIKQVVADGGITDDSWHSELRGWFEPLVEGLASGPPPLRIAQLAALVRAGVVRFVGPAPIFAFDADESLFTAASPWVKGASFTARYLVEAMMLANRVSTTLSPLLRSLIGRGIVRPRTTLSESGGPVTTGGLDVSSAPYRAIDQVGRPQASLFVLGLQLSSVQWGTAIAAEAGADLEAGARTLLDADRIARAILRPRPSRGLGPGRRELHRPIR